MNKPAIMKYGEFSVNENKEQKYDYGCAMLHFDFPDMKAIHESIDPDDVYVEEEDRSYGLEKDPHVTLLYGFHKNVDGDTIRKICESHTFGDIKLHTISHFENPKFDVLKFDVDGNSLHECNKDLSKLPHTTDFPDYHPHATIGYLKRGTAKKYIDSAKNESYIVKPKAVVYSMSSGEKLKWDI